MAEQYVSAIHYVLPKVSSEDNLNCDRGFNEM